MTALTPWAERVSEEANLFNPYFLALIIRQVAKEYESSRGEGLPYMFPFMFVPVLLHEHSRETLPYTSRTDLVVWLTENPDIRFLTPRRVQLLRPYVQEALLVGMRDEILTFEHATLSLTVGPKRITQARLDRTQSTAGEILRTGQKMGRWLARNGTWEYQLTIWGIAL